MNSFLFLLLSAGGAAFLTAVIAGLKTLTTTRLESEAALIKRLNDSAKSAEEDADKQRARAERAERYSETLRAERDDALERVARYKRLLIKEGVDLLENNDHAPTD